MEGGEREDELGQLARDVKKLVDENRKFLDRLMDDEFEEDDEPGEEMPAV